MAQLASTLLFTVLILTVVSLAPELSGSFSSAAAQAEAGLSDALFCMSSAIRGGGC